jgi:hypothetical protein
MKTKENEKKKNEMKCYEKSPYEKAHQPHTPWTMQSDVEGSMESTDFFSFVSLLVNPRL